MTEYIEYIDCAIPFELNRFRRVSRPLDICYFKITGQRDDKGLIQGKETWTYVINGYKFMVINYKDDVIHGECVRYINQLNPIKHCYYNNNALEGEMISYKINVVPKNIN